MEVSVPSNTNYPEGGDYGRRTSNMGYAARPNEPRGDYYASTPREQDYGYPPRQYFPHEREFVATQRSCSHCQAHCCQRPAEYQNQPAGSRGERLERYAPAPVAAESVVDVGSSTEGQSAPHNPGPGVEAPPVNEKVGSANAHPPTNQPPECSAVPSQEPAELTSNMHDAACSGHQPEQIPTPHRCQSTYAPSESPFIAEARNLEPTGQAIPQARFSEPNMVHTTSSAPLPCAAQSVPVLGTRVTNQDSVASLMVPSSPRQTVVPPGEESQKFNPATLTHLNFKEKQLAMSAIKKAATNMSCLSMFQDKDKQNCGRIGRRDFQIVMDRVGVLRGMSSREIDAVFKGFSAHSDTEIDYKKFSAACKHAIENDHRLSRMAHK